MDAKDRIIEIQGSAEKVPFSSRQFTALFDMARAGIHELIKLQKQTIKAYYERQSS